MQLAIQGTISFAYYNLTIALDAWRRLGLGPFPGRARSLAVGLHTKEYRLKLGGTKL